VRITGGSGFIGSAVARALIARGDEAVVVDRRDGCDILTTDLREVLYGCDSVIRLAWLYN
jgi:nucleoside-diphosphate-sugar epimerase